MFGKSREQLLHTVELLVHEVNPIEPFVARHVEVGGLGELRPVIIVSNGSSRQPFGEQQTANESKVLVVDSRPRPSVVGAPVHVAVRGAHEEQLIVDTALGDAANLEIWEPVAQRPPGSVRDVIEHPHPAVLRAGVQSIASDRID